MTSGSIKKIIQNKQLKESCAIFMLTNLQDRDGNTYYAFYAIRADVAHLFVEKMQKEKVELEKYGVIIEAFPGHPSEKILNMVKESFGDNAVL